MVKVTHCTQLFHGLLLFCCLLTSACSVAPVKGRNQIPQGFPRQFAGQTLPAAQKGPFWAESFPSDLLQTDIQTVIGKNFELKAARARMEQVSALYGSTRAAFFPSVNAEANIGRSRKKEASVSTTSNNTAFTVSSSWELDIWGRLRTRSKAAALSLEEQWAIMEQTTLDLQTLLVESWVSHHAAHKLELIQAEQQQTNAQLLELI